MRNHSRKGQITVFIIMGMIILFFFLIVSYQSNLKKQELLDTAEKQITTMLESSSVKNYINLCIEKVAKEGFILLGKQGGYIYEYQGGIAPLRNDNLTNKPLYKNFQGYNLSYSLYYNQSKNITYLSPPPPMYPANPNTGKITYFNDVTKLIWPGYPTSSQIMFMQDGKQKDPFRYYLGDVQNFFPKLCLKEGTNYQSAQNQSWQSAGCGYGAYGEIGEYTIQEQMQEYINNNIKSCTNLDNLSLYLPEFSSMEISEGDIQTNLLFGNQEVSIKVNYPIEAKINQRNSRMVMSGFSVSVPIRFKSIWKHLDKVLYEDSVKFSYNKSNYRTIKGSYWDNEFSSSFISLNYDEIYSLIDRQSLVNDKAYEFNILFQNRAPALEYIHFLSSQRPDLDCFDIITMPGATITIKPDGYDPDEDKLTFNYKGWNQEYSSIFDERCFFMNGGTVDCTKDITVFEECETKNNDNGPHAWTGPFSEYNKDGKTGEYKVKDADIGLHTLKVLVNDGELSDWQEVKILVLDVPTVIISVSNIYDDIDDDYASVEDFSIVDSSKSNAMMASLKNFYYELKKDSAKLWNFTLPKSISIQLPRETPDDTTFYSIEEITKPLTYQFKTFGNYTFTIRADNGFVSGSSNKTIEVMQCLPHRDSSIPSYPYNLLYNLTMDPYQANHTCCLGDPNGDVSDWEVATISQSCFSLYEYGGFMAFNQNYLKTIYELNSTPNFSLGIMTFGDKISSADNLGLIFNTGFENKKNDIFSRSYTRNCDGTRGNICNGTVYDVIDTVESCNDNNQGTGGVRTCAGPPWEYIENTRDRSISCDNYTGTTFEYLISDRTDPSLENCEDIALCSSETTYDVSLGHYVCNATCDGAGGCTKSSGCYDCYSENTCTRSTTDTSYNVYNSGYIYGDKYDSCANNPSGECNILAYGQTNYNDYCLPDGKTLGQYKCLTSPEIITNNEPFSLVTYDCTLGNGAEKCEEIGTTGKYHSKEEGFCSLDVCKDNVWDKDCEFYSCDLGGINCRTTCSIHSDCSDDAFCGSGCEPKKNNAITCNGDYECSSGNCAESMNGNNYCIDAGYCVDDSTNRQSEKKIINEYICGEELGNMVWFKGTFCNDNVLIDSINFYFNSAVSDNTWHTSPQNGYC